MDLSRIPIIGKGFAKDGIFKTTEEALKKIASDSLGIYSCPCIMQSVQTMIIKGMGISHATIPAMNEQEVINFLQSKLNLQLATIDENGDPNIQPVWFDYEKDSEKLTS